MTLSIKQAREVCEGTPLRSVIGKIIRRARRKQKSAARNAKSKRLEQTTRHLTRKQSLELNQDMGLTMENSVEYNRRKLARAARWAYRNKRRNNPRTQARKTPTVGNPLLPLHKRPEGMNYAEFRYLSRKKREETKVTETQPRSLHLPTILTKQYKRVSEKSGRVPFNNRKTTPGRVNVEQKISTTLSYLAPLYLGPKQPLGRIEARRTHTKVIKHQHNPSNGK